MPVLRSVSKVEWNGSIAVGTMLDARCSMLRARKSEEGEDGALNGEILNQSTIKERMVGTSTFVSTKTSKVRMG